MKQDATKQQKQQVLLFLKTLVLRHACTCRKKLFFGADFRVRKQRHKVCFNFIACNICAKFEIVAKSAGHSTKNHITIIAAGSK